MKIDIRNILLRTAIKSALDDQLHVFKSFSLFFSTGYFESSILGTSAHTNKITPLTCL